MRLLVTDMKCKDFDCFWLSKISKSPLVWRGNRPAWRLFWWNIALISSVSKPLIKQPIWMMLYHPQNAWLSKKLGRHRVWCAQQLVSRANCMLILITGTLAAHPRSASNEHLYEWRSYASRYCMLTWLAVTAKDAACWRCENKPHWHQWPHEIRWWC